MNGKKIYIYIYIYFKNILSFSVFKSKYERMRRNRKIILLFRSLSEGNEMKHLFLPIPSKPQIFIPLQNLEE